MIIFGGQLMKQIKKQAKTILKENFKIAILGIFITYLIPFLLCDKQYNENTMGFNMSVKNWTFILLIVVQAAFAIGRACFLLNLAEDNKNAKLEDILLGFKKFPKALGLYLSLNLIYIFEIILLSIFIAVGTANLNSSNIISILIILVFAVVIIFTKILLSQCYFIIAGDTSKGIFETIKAGIKLMKGNKFKYIKLVLSFIGWFLLMFIAIMAISFFAVIECNQIIMKIGLPIVFLVLGTTILPYWDLTAAVFYLKIKQEKNDDQFDKVNEVNYISDPE